MKPKDIFDIIARTAGLVVVLYGLGHLLYGVLGAMGLFQSTAGRYNAVTGIIEVIGGLMVMRRVIPVADIAYPPETTTTQDDQTRSTQPKKEDETHAAS
jgi:hypothetical protein